MTTKCHCYLPADVRVDDVAKVLGILAGLEKRWENLGQGYKCVRVDGTKVEGIRQIPEMVEISIEAQGENTFVNGKKSDSFYYHYEADDGTARGLKILSMGSSPFYIALAKGVVDFFGGRIDYNDCDDQDADYIKKKRRHNNPRDGKDWDTFEEAMFNLKSITKDDIRRAKKLK